MITIVSERNLKRITFYFDVIIQDFLSTRYRKKTNSLQINTNIFIATKEIKPGVRKP